MTRRSIKFRMVSLSAIALITLMWFAGCSSDNSVEPQELATTDQQAMKTIAESDESIASFEPNYNDGDAVAFALGKIATTVYPVKVSHRVVRIASDLQTTVQGDTSYGVLTQTYSGTLKIYASYTPALKGDTASVDTVITKEFTSQITRNIIFVKVAKTRKPIDNWKIAAISLPEGGTMTANVSINNMIVYMPGDTLLINSPNDYYLYRNVARKRFTPQFSKGQEIKVRIEVYSAYADTELVSVTYGADKKGFNRSKRTLTLVSSVPGPAGFTKIYESTWKANNYMGHYHAVVNVIPKQVLNDDAAPVEEKTWGIPYYIK